MVITEMDSPKMQALLTAHGVIGKASCVYASSHASSSLTLQDNCGMARVVERQAVTALDRHGATCCPCGCSMPWNPCEVSCTPRLTDQACFEFGSHDPHAAPQERSCVCTGANPTRKHSMPYPATSCASASGGSKVPCRCPLLPNTKREKIPAALHWNLTGFACGEEIVGGAGPSRRRRRASSTARSSS